MNIKRTGDCPVFLDYVLKNVLIPRHHTPSHDFIKLLTYGGVQWMDIPSYQRGLVWNQDLLENLVSSRSIFLGNAVLGNFPIPRDQPGFNHLPEGPKDYAILLDGLQRFSVGTALLSLLFPKVLSDTPEWGDLAQDFLPLKQQIGAKVPVFLHNHAELSKHPRKAVSDSYKVFCEKLERWIHGRHRDQETADLAGELLQLFLERQIAPDLYHGFQSVYEMASTFIGLNTVRVQLNIIDWLRAIVIDQGGRAGWNPDEIEALENRFSEVFNREDGSQPRPELIPLASILKQVLGEEEFTFGECVFPSWKNGLQLNEVHRLLDFVDEMVTHSRSPYLREIRCCGAIPFAGIILYYYRLLLTEEKKPDFLGGDFNSPPELWPYLRGYYRVVLDDRVGKTREYAKRLLVSDITPSETGSALSTAYLGKSLDEPVDDDWLKATLKETEKKHAPRVFNACLLPEWTAGDVQEFIPHQYGSTAQHYQVDHLIPNSVLKKHEPGGVEGQLLMNFAPVSKPTNVKQLNIPCSHKLAEGGVFANEVTNNPDAHPYLEWLVNQQGPYGSRLDLQVNLQTADPQGIGQERIEWIAERLKTRL